MGSDPLRQALGKDAPGAFGVAAGEPPRPQSDAHPAPERGQVSRLPAIAAVHGTARAPAIRAATTGPDAVGGIVKPVGTVRRDRLDAAARHGAMLVHALFYGHNCRRSQISVQNRCDPRKARRRHQSGSTSASYAATKAAITALGAALNQELRLAGADRIKIVTVEPWGVDTPSYKHAANYTGRATRMPELEAPWESVDALVWAAIHPFRGEYPVGWRAAGGLVAPRSGPNSRPASART